MISREEFSVQTIEQQVAMVNTYLLRGLSIIKVFKSEINCNESTFRARAKKAGYLLDQEKNQYIKKDSTQKDTEKHVQKNTNIPLPIEEVHKDITKVYTENEDIACIREMLPMLKEMLAWYTRQKNVINVEPLQMQKFSGTVESKTFRIYKSVLSDFLVFAAKNKQYKQQDLVSQALAEFLEKYDFGGVQK